ncbi:MAG TPA: hypothetical protein PLK35_00620 [Candidatus Moranbacteria bacterium]|nr:hypothetical protein [Candidatus Moranbacteria bacterium]
MNNPDNIILVVVDGLINFYNSTTFAVIKFILGIYAAVLFVDIILLLIQRGLGGDIKDTFLGMNLPREFVRKRPKDKLKIKWEKIKSKLDNDNKADLKMAIIEADDLIDDLIKKMKYPGDNFGERLENINPGQIENIEDLKKSHLMRNRIIHEEKFELTKKEAEEILASYEEFLRAFEVVD